MSVFFGNRALRARFVQRACRTAAMSAASDDMVRAVRACALDRVGDLAGDLRRIGRAGAQNDPVFLASRV
jgi:hypothetical protein